MGRWLTTTIKDDECGLFQFIETCPGNAVVGNIREENVETGESSSAALPDDLREYNFRSLPGENSSLGSSDNAASNSELFLQQGEVEKQMDKERQNMQVYFHPLIFHI
nr:2142_t:CDS:2 [Entrophospora candida]